MTSAYEETLKCVPYIHYLVWFKKNTSKVQILINSESEINAIHLIFARQQGFFIRPIDIGAKKIDDITLDTYKMVVAAFLMTNKVNQVKFFEETFLVANVSPKVVLGIFFLILSCANVNFLDRKLKWRTYITQEILSTTKCVKLVEKKEFEAIVLNPEHETFVVYIASLSATSFSSTPLNIHPFCKS